MHDGRSELVLYVDGKRIAEALDPDGPDRFPAIGLTAETSEVGTDIFFDNVLAWNALAGRPSTPEQNRDTSPQQFPAPARPTSRICKRDGIRYSGATAEGGEVCFTVTEDHKRLLEVGFTFVPANGCPEMANGTVHAGGEAGPTVTRDRVRSSGFTATSKARRRPACSRTGISARSAHLPGGPAACRDVRPTNGPHRRPRSANARGRAGAPRPRIRGRHVR